MQTPFSFRVEVTNTAPYFWGSLHEVTVKQGESKTYTLPQPIDDENQNIILSTYE